MGCFCLVGFVIAGVLAWQGLVEHRLPISREQVIRGRAARIFGALCVVVMLLMLAGMIWSQAILKFVAPYMP